MKGIQIIGMLVGVYLIYQTYYDYKKGNLGLSRGIIHLILWGSMIVLFSNPSFALFVLPLFTTEDMIMTVLVTSILLLFVMINNLQHQLSENNKMIIRLVQNLAIEDHMSRIEKDN